jgi:hypothetical protein
MTTTEIFRRLVRWCRPALSALVLMTLPTEAQAHDKSGPSVSPSLSRLAYRVSAGPTLGLDSSYADGLDADVRATGGAVLDAFVGRVLSPYSAMGLDVRLSLTLPAISPKLGDVHLQRPGSFNGALLWQVDWDVGAETALRLGFGGSWARLVESSGAVTERNAFGLAGIFGIPITLHRYGYMARRTRFVPALMLSRTSNGADAPAAFAGNFVALLSFSAEVAFDAQSR